MRVKVTITESAYQIKKWCEDWRKGDDNVAKLILLGYGMFSETEVSCMRKFVNALERDPTYRDYEVVLCSTIRKLAALIDNNASYKEAYDDLVREQFVWV